MNLNPQKFREVGDVFLKLHEENPEREVNMSKPDFSPCETVACHAGWWAVSQSKKSSAYYDYINAANNLARYLGFIDSLNMKAWASAVPRVWGNKAGISMFGSARAFGVKPEELNLKVIGEHYHAVAKRLEEQHD